MAEDQRNFRSYYYSKVGFPSVEEKKSLQILFKDNELDDVKLAQFCLRFPLPTVYRMLTWKVLLKILPRFQTNHEFVWKVKCDIYHETHIALLVTNVADVRNPIPVQFLKMYLLSESRLRFNHIGQEKDEQSQHFMAIARVFVELCPSVEEAYWLTTNFYNYVRKFSEHFPCLMDLVEVVLKKEDLDLHNHLSSIGSFRDLDDLWFGRVFAGVLPVVSLVRIWDRIIGGSVRILAFVAASLLMGLGRNLLAATNRREVFSAFGDIAAETAEMIVKNAIELWQTHGNLSGPGIGDGLRPRSLEAQQPKNEHRLSKQKEQLSQ